jgi:hypothetical protein
VTIRAITGLALLNLSFAAAGAALLWGLRGWRRWWDVARLGGVAYLLGLAGTVVLLTLALTAGVPFSGWTVVAAPAVLLAGGVALALRRGHARPQLKPRIARLTVPAALGLAALGVYFEALFRSARLMPLSEWDAWWCWTLRAKAIFYFHGLDQGLFGAEAPRCPGYPPGFSAVEAAGFHAMGSVDVVTLHVQYWFLALGFVGALAGLLAPRVRQSILLPFLVLVLLLPSFTSRVTDGRADLPLDYLVAVGALLVLLWLEAGRAWHLPVATVLFGAALLTKREGLLLVVCVLAAALVASWPERRRAWPPLLAVGGVAVVLALPWRLWLMLEGRRSGAPEGGYLEVLEHPGRVPASLRLVARTLFDYDLWLLLAPLALVAALLALVAGQVRVAVYTAVFVATSVAACTWAISAEPALEITQDYGLNPVVRLVGGPVLTLAALTPLVLERAWAGMRAEPAAGAGEASSGGAPARRRTAISRAIVLVAVLGYPLSALAGYSGLRLPGGLPDFPAAEECVQAPVPGGQVRLVLGYVDSYRAADDLEERGREAGVGDAVTGHDGCGRLRVFVPGVPASAARALVARAAAAGLHPTLERDPAS